MLTGSLLRARVGSASVQVIVQWHQFHTALALLQELQLVTLPGGAGVATTTQQNFVHVVPCVFPKQTESPTPGLVPQLQPSEQFAAVPPADGA
jgi:hypothetical protein